MNGSEGYISKCDRLTKEVVYMREVIIALRYEVVTVRAAHGVTESLLKIAHNDIAAFFPC